MTKIEILSHKKLLCIYVLCFQMFENSNVWKYDEGIVDAIILLRNGTGHKRSRGGDDARRGVELVSALLLQPIHCAMALGTSARVVATMRGRAWS
jgi:hypothetical protein